jgi:hypothetical protein
MESSKADKCCDPTKVVMSFTEKCGTVTLGLAVTLIPPVFTNPYYICPTSVGSNLIIQYVVTNLSTTCTINTPRYVSDTLTGVHTVGKGKLRPGESDTFLTYYTIPASACGTGDPAGTIVSEAVAYVHYDHQCTVLITQETTTIDGIIPIP